MARNKTTEKLNLSNINNYYLDGLIRIPEYQRDKVWTKYQKQLLIDSILRDIDIPKIYFDVEFDENETEIYNVVEKFKEVKESIVVGQSWNNDIRIILIGVLNRNYKLNQNIKSNSITINISVFILINKQSNDAIK